MKKQILYLIVLMNISLNSLAQTSFHRLYQTIGADGVGFSGQQTNDGGYIFVGNNNSNQEDIYLVKTNANGDPVWTKTFPNSFPDLAYAVKQTFDGGFIITGEAYSFGLGSSDFYLIKTDFLGNTQWIKAYGSNDGENGLALQQTSDMGYIIAGFTLGFGGYRVFVVKTDSNGDTLWTKGYGGGNYSIAYSVQQTSDGGFIITGATDSSGSRDVYLIKTDNIGNIMWAKSYGGPADDYGKAVKQTSDGGYIVTGYYTDNISTDESVYLIKTDANGDTLWTKTFGGASFDEGNSVQQTDDGGYIISGHTYSFGSPSGSTYLIKTDNNGSVEWSNKYYFGVEINNSLEITSDKGFIIVGSVTNYAYLIKTDSMGNSGCNQSATATITTTPSTQVLNIVPTVYSGANIVAVPASLSPSGSIVSTPCSQAPYILNTISPIEIAPTGTYVFEVSGEGLTTLTNFSLTKSGENPIIADSIIIIDNKNLKAIFNLDTSITLGNWTPSAIFSNQDTSSLIDVILVSPYQEPKLSVKITGHNIMRVLSNQLYNVTITNDGNVDAYFPPVFISGLPPGTRFEIIADTLLSGNAIQLFDTLGLNWDSLSTNVVYNDLDSLMSLFPILIYKIPSKSSITFSVIFHVPLSTPFGSSFRINIFLGNPLFTSVTPNAQFRIMNADCVRQLLNISLQILENFSGNPALQCISNVVNLVGDVMNQVLQKSDDVSLTQKYATAAWDYGGIMRGVFNSAATCFIAFGPAGPALMVAIAYEVFQKRQKWTNLALDIGDFVTACAVPWLEEDDDILITYGGAQDPNIKIGPGGSSFNHYLNDDDEMVYSILFENDSTATLPAQTIIVYDTLDVSKFDLSTFHFTNVSLGYKSFSTNEASSFEGTIDFSNEYGVNARIIGQLNTVTGVVAWIINTIDTATNQITLNPSHGILPPNTASPSGEGSVSFRIKLLDSVTNADTIRNSANIVFDNNAPIITPVWQIVIDTIKPQSNLIVSSSITTADSVLVNWSGTDVFSGIKSYSVYVSNDSINYYQWITNTSDTMAYFFKDTSVTTIYFYSIAQDSAGNIEDAPAFFDASTTFITGLNEYANGIEKILIFPNPTDKTLNLIIRPKKLLENLVVTVSDILGQTLIKREYMSTLNEIHDKFDVNSLSSGIYLVEIKSDSGKVLKKFVKN